MKLDEFIQLVDADQPPKDISQNLQALWHDAKGDWHKAHEIVQETSGYDGDWIHAYLHRKEGDLGNAGYWYSRIGKLRPNISLENEWTQLVEYLLQKEN